MGKVQESATEDLEPGSLGHPVCCERLCLAASQQSEHLSSHSEQFSSPCLFPGQ